MCCNIQAEDGAGSKLEAMQAVHICISEIRGYEGEEKDEIRVSHSNLKDRVIIDSMDTLRVRPENVHNMLNLECPLKHRTKDVGYMAAGAITGW